MDRTFVTDGVEIRPAVLSSQEIANIQAEVSVDHEILRRTGIRNLEKKFRSIAQIAADSSVLSIAASVLGKTPQLVRALFFDKTEERNWFVLGTKIGQSLWTNDSRWTVGHLGLGKMAYTMYSHRALY